MTDTGFFWSEKTRKLLILAVNNHLLSCGMVPSCVMIIFSSLSQRLLKN